MSRVQFPRNQAYTVVTDNAGVLSSFIFGIDGTFTASKLSVKVSGFNGFFTHANTADRIYTLPDRAGTLSLQDITSLLAMLPSVSGQSGKFLSNDGSTLSWQATAAGGLVTFNGINTSTYNAQTLAIGSAGLAPAWVSIGNNIDTHTLNIPMAATASVTAGLISNADYSNIPFKNTNNTFDATQTFTNAPIITTPSTASNAAATYGQIQASQAGFSVRLPVDAIDTVLTALPTANPTIDGRVIQLNDRVLFTALTAGGNKVYKATGSLSSIIWTLEIDGQVGTGVATDGDLVFVKNGTVHADQTYAFNGTAWVLYSVAQSWTFSTGLNVVGQTVTVAYGTTGTTACVGNDTRLSDSRIPLAHQLDGALHTISGKTAGQALIATSATTFAFVSYTGDISLDGLGATTVNKIKGTTVENLALTILSATLTDNTAAATLVTGASFPIATLRNVRIDFSLSRGAGNYACGYLNILHDGTNAYLTQVFDIEFGTLGVVFSADISGGNLRLLFTTTSAGSAATLKFNTLVMPQ